MNYKKLFNNHKSNFIGTTKINISSVVIPIINIEGEDRIIFEVRSKKLKAQPGEVSFPGGRVDLGETPKNAAIREFSEELSCSRNDVHIVTEISKYITPHKGLIYSYLGLVDENLNLNVKNDEVEELFTVPVSFFLDNEPEEYINKIKTLPSEEFPFDKMNVSKDYFDMVLYNKVIFYKYGSYVIWGITAYIVKNFIDTLKLKQNKF